MPLSVLPHMEGLSSFDGNEAQYKTVHQTHVQGQYYTKKLMMHRSLFFSQAHQLMGLM